MCCWTLNILSYMSLTFYGVWVEQQHNISSQDSPSLLFCTFPLGKILCLRSLTFPAAHLKFVHCSVVYLKQYNCYNLLLSHQRTCGVSWLFLLKFCMNSTSPWTTNFTASITLSSSSHDGAGASAHTSTTQFSRDSYQRTRSRKGSGRGKPGKNLARIRDHRDQTC